MYKKVFKRILGFGSRPPSGIKTVTFLGIQSPRPYVLRNSSSTGYILSKPS